VISALKTANRFVVGMILRQLSVMSDDDLKDCCNLFPEQAHELTVIVHALRKDKETRK
jgi:hypothetical protein